MSYPRSQTRFAFAGLGTLTRRYETLALSCSGNYDPPTTLPDLDELQTRHARLSSAACWLGLRSLLANKPFQPFNFNRIRSREFSECTKNYGRRIRP